MAAARPDDASLARARLRGKRAGIVVIIVVAVAFIGGSAAQIIPAIFGVDITPIPAAPPGSSERTCAEGVRRLALAVEPPGDGGAQGGPSAPEEWDGASAVEQACSRSSEGRDAWAALARLRSASQQLARRDKRDRADLDSLRRDVAAHLPADLR